MKSSYNDGDEKDGSDDVGGDEVVFITIINPDGRKLLISDDDEIEVDDYIN